MKPPLYLSGPMSGLPNLNFPAFHAAADALRDAGYEVINPAEHDEEPGKAWEDYLREDIKQLMTCHTVVTLPGWEDSRGAKLEVGIARQLGMEVVEFSVWKDMEVASRVKSITWHPASKKPESGKDVLCWADGKCFCGWWDAKEKRWLAFAGCAVVLDVTHWAEPEGPGVAAA